MIEERQLTPDNRIVIYQHHHHDGNDIIILDLMMTSV